MRCYGSNSSSCVGRSNDRPARRQIESSWCALREDASGLEASTLHGAAGDLTAVASGTFPLVLEAHVKADARQPKLSPETIVLIKEMASNNRLWGAERIRGELLKLGIPVCKRTIQKYMRHVRLPRPGSQKRPTFLRNH